MGFVRLFIKLSVLFFVLSFASTGLAADGLEDTNPSVCISCHESLEGNLAEPVRLWKESYHYQMGNQCEGCHGGDPTDEETAMSPEKGFVGSPQKREVVAFCGKCHVGVKENFIESVHYSKSAQAEGPTCITCHQSHDVKKASLSLINETLCSQCHSFENGLKIKKAFEKAEWALQDYQHEQHYLKKRGMPVKPLEKKLFALRNSLHQMTHTFEVNEIQQKTTEVLKELNGMDAEINAFHQKIKKRWIGGAVVALFLILLITVLSKLLKTYEEEE